VTVDYTQPPAAPPPPPPPPGQPAAPQKSSGCWKWGCGGCVVVILVGCAALAVCVFVIFSFIKGSDVYRGAREKVVNDPRVVSALGTPIKHGYWVSGKVNVSGQGGEADFKFPLSGPKDSATVHAVATRDQNGWTYTDLTVMPSHGPPIEVLKP
jgi:hypothetical protein